MGSPSQTRDVVVREVGPRDGLQLEAPLPTADKIALLEALVATGVQRIEATAFVSPRAMPTMADAEAIGEAVRRWPQVEWSALVASQDGARRAVSAGFTSIEYVVSVSDSHSLANVRRTTHEALDAVAEIVEIVATAGGSVEVIFATAWDCPFEGETPPARTAELARRAIGAGADTVCLGDTIGTTVPGRVTRLLDEVRAAVPGSDVGVHFHDTRGTGLASAWAAVQAGVTRLDASTGGLGGCPFAPGASGNIPTEGLVYMLENSGITTGLDIDAILAAAALTRTLVGHELDSALVRAGGPSRARGVFVPT